MPVIETIASCNKLQQKKSLELAWDPLTGESLVDQVLIGVLAYEGTCPSVAIFLSFFDDISMPRTMTALTLAERAMLEDSPPLQQGFVIFLLGSHPHRHHDHLHDNQSSAWSR